MTMFIKRRMLLRRALMASTALVAVTACANMTVTRIAQQALTDTQLLASGVAKIIPQLGSIPGITAAVESSATSIINNIDSAAATLSSTITTVQAQPSESKIEGYFDSLVTILGTFGTLIPAPIGTILTAAEVLLPFILQTVGLPVAASTRYGAAAAKMTVAEARVILAGGAQ
jgi:hypothetical protein